MRLWQAVTASVLAGGMLAAQATVLYPFPLQNYGDPKNWPLDTGTDDDNHPAEHRFVNDVDAGRYGERIKIVEPGRTFFGKSYNELAGAWWNWALAEPVDTNVVLDPDGSFCALNQKGKVWFLAGTFGGIAERTCEVPAGKAIFFPLLNTTTYEEVITTPECFEQELPDASLLDRLRCDVAFAIPQLLSAEINGEPVKDLNAYLAQSQPGGYTQIIIENNIFALPPGEKTPAVANGFWIYLQPLPPGRHHISFSADSDNDGELDLGADYHLLIVGGDDDDDDDEKEEDIRDR